MSGKDDVLKALLGAAMRDNVKVKMSISEEDDDAFSEKVSPAKTIFTLEGFWEGLNEQHPALKPGDYVVYRMPSTSSFSTRTKIGLVKELIEPVNLWEQTAAIGELRDFHGVTVTHTVDCIVAYALPEDGRMCIIEYLQDSRLLRPLTEEEVEKLKGSFVPEEGS